MTLRQLVAHYLNLAGTFGAPVALSDFGLAASEVEKVFSGYDEDYHISRFFHFANDSGPVYLVDSQPVTHIVIDAEISSIL
jgi:hypothetical protein